MQTQSWPRGGIEGEQAASLAPCAERGDGRGGEAALRLDKRTYLDLEQGRFKAILRDYGGGLGEVGWAFIPSRRPFNAGGGGGEPNEKNADRACRRAQSRIRQLVLSANLDHLLTLTYRDNVTELRQASDDLRRFIRTIRTKLPGFLYVAVPERQKRGAWHWHLAVAGRQDVVLLRRLWLRVVGDGNIDVQKPRSQQNRRLALVRYLGKYLAKGFADEDKELHRHRFRASLGIEVPSETIEIPEHMRGDVATYAAAQLRERSGSVGFVWDEQALGVGWACSW